MGVVVVHGFTGNPRTTRPLGKSLAERGFAVEVPRLPGHGTHWRDLARTRYADWRAAVVESVERVRENRPRVVLVGHSMGGALVLDVASQRTDIAGVVTINPPVLDRRGLLARLAPVLSRAIPLLPSRLAGLAKNDAARPGVDERAYAWIPTRSAESLLEALPRIRAQLRRLAAPLLAAYSLQDHSVPPENTTALPGLVGSSVELLPLERSYHLATLDYDRELLEERVADFVARACASGPAQHATSRS